jgi:micrococcal nuclease
VPRGTRRLIGAAFVLGVAILGTLTVADEARATHLPPGQATVTRDVDGDTVDVRIGSRTERVRLLGINTPETVDPRKPVECYGHQASARTAQLIPPGTRVRLERDVEPRDKYGRLLAYIYRVDDGTDVNLTLVAEGDAVVLTIPPNGARVSQLTAASRAAQAAGLGLWGVCPSETAR